MEKHEHYTYRITWSAEDSEYVGLCTEFPLCHGWHLPVPLRWTVLKSW